MKTWEGNWPTLGHFAIEYIEDNARHGLGPVMGKTVQLTDDECRFLLKRYQVHPKALCGRPGCDCPSEVGKWRYTWAVRSRLKGARKSEFGSWLTAFELDGPARFAGWDATGEPVAASIHDLGGTPDIICLATAEEQTEDTIWSSFTSWLPGSPIIDHLEVLKDRVNHKYGGNARIRSSSSLSRDGGRPTFSVCEETHLWITSELRELDKTNRRNLAKLDALDPWGLALTTMFRPGQGSVAEKDWRLAFGAESDPTILYDHREAAKRADEHTDAGLLACAKDAIGDCHWLSPARILRNYKTDPVDGERYWFNRRVSAGDIVIDPEVWQDCRRAIEPQPKDVITLGFDGSEVDDTTGLIATRVADGYQWVAGFWVPEDTGIQAMHDQVAEALEWLFTEYEVVRLYADPPYWQDDLARWRGKHGDGKVLAWWTNRDNAMTWATHRWVTAINGRHLTHDGDPFFANHVANTRRRETRTVVDVLTDEEGKHIKKRGFVLRKEHHHSDNKIDLAVCSVLSWEARADVIAAGLADPKRKRTRRLRTY